MKAPAGADTAPLHVDFSELVVSLKTNWRRLRCITVWLPRVLRLLITLFGVWVEGHRNLENDFRKHVSEFCVSLQPVEEFWTLRSILVLLPCAYCCFQRSLSLPTS